MLTQCTYKGSAVQRIATAKLAVGKSIFLGVALALVFLGPSGGTGYAQTYAVTDLGALGGSENFGAAINSSGQITGWAFTPGDAAGHAYIYTAGANPPMVDLGTLPCAGCAISAGLGINDLGQVTGFSLVLGASSTLPYPHAFIYSPGASPAMVDLGAMINLNPPGASVGFLWSWGFGINSAGQVAGPYYVDSLSGPAYPCFQQGRAFLYTPGASPAFSDLGSLGGTSPAPGPGCQTDTDWGGMPPCSWDFHCPTYRLEVRAPGLVV